MRRAVVATPCRTPLGRWRHRIANAASLLGLDTPLDMVIGRIEFNTIALAFAFAIREFGKCFPSLPARFAMPIVSSILKRWDVLTIPSLI